METITVLESQVAGLIGLIRDAAVKACFSNNKNEFAEYLGRMVHHWYDDQYMGASVGLDWMLRQPDFFAVAVPDVAAFIRAHLDARCFGELLIQYQSLLEQVPVRDRDSLVSDVFVRCGSRNNGWVDVALSVGVSKETIATAITERIMSLPVHDQHGCSTHDAADFVRAGEVVWRVFNDGQLFGVLALCADRHPASVVAERAKISQRLGEMASMELAIRAAGNLKVVLHQNLANLMVLPLEVRKRLCVQLETKSYAPAMDITAQLIVATLLELVDDNRACMDFYRQLLPVFREVSAVALYIAARPHLSKMRDWLRTAFEQGLRYAGFEVGTIEESLYTPRGQHHSVRQFVVRRGRFAFVQDRDSHRYYPTVGDTVLFQPGSGLMLTPTVKAVQFTQVK